MPLPPKKMYVDASSTGVKRRNKIMDPNSILVSALINILIDVFKGFPFFKNSPHYLPLVALGLGTIIWPLYIATFSAATFVTGCLVGAGAIGLYEVSNSIGKQRKDSSQTIKEVKEIEKIN